MRNNEEYQLQKRIVQYLRLQYPEILFCASAGGMRTSIQQAVKMKAMGYQRGYPDMHIAEPRQGWHGMFIEFKSKTGTLSEYQIAWQQRLVVRGYHTIVCKEFEIAKKEIDNYLRG